MYLDDWIKHWLMFPFSFPFSTKCNNFKIQRSRSAYSRPKSLSSTCVMHSTHYTVTVQICRLILHSAVVIVGACYHAQCHYTDPVDTNTRYVRLDLCQRLFTSHTLTLCYHYFTLLYTLYCSLLILLSCSDVSLRKMWARASIDKQNINKFSF